jgi:thymidylate synthase (FAD)
MATMPRPTVDAADALLDTPIQVLDKGFVRLVDYLGSDARIVQSARVSYGTGTKSVREDAALIDYLMRHRHTSPFEQVVLTFHVKMPIFVARQWIRHRTARLNEISGRYSVMEDTFYVPEPDQVRSQGKHNKQGSGQPVEHPEAFINRVNQQQQDAYTHYEQTLEQGIARELARINLPLSLYTEMYWQIDLHNLFHFLALRLDGHAQYEIRVYAEALATCAQAVAPRAYDAFCEHHLGARTLSASELDLLKTALDVDALQNALTDSDMRPSKKRELLEKLGFSDPNDSQTNDSQTNDSQTNDSQTNDSQTNDHTHNQTNNQAGTS